MNILLVEDHNINKVMMNLVIKKNIKNALIDNIDNINDLNDLIYNQSEDNLNKYKLIFMDRDILWWNTINATKDLLKKDIPIIGVSHSQFEFVEQTWLNYSLPKHFTTLELIDVLKLINI